MKKKILSLSIISFLYLFCENGVSEIELLFASKLAKGNEKID